MLLNGIANPVADVSVEGNSVSLTLTDAVTWDDTVSLSYTPPQDSAASRIKDRWSQAAAAIDNMDLTPSLETPSPPRNVAVSADQVSRLNPLLGRSEHPAPSASIITAAGSVALGKNAAFHRSPRRSSPSWS